MPLPSDGLSTAETSLASCTGPPAGLIRDVPGSPSQIASAATGSALLPPLPARCHTRVRRGWGSHRGRGAPRQRWSAAH